YTVRNDFIHGITYHSNLAKITIMASMPDGANNAGDFCPSVGQPVNVTNGNMWLRQTDYFVPGVGDQLEVTRFYNSIVQSSGMCVIGWSTTYDVSLEFYGDFLIRLNTPDGRAMYFTRENATDIYTPQSPELYGSIQNNLVDTYTLTSKAGWKSNFSPTGRLKWKKDRNGNQTTLTYDINNVLTSVTDPSGRTLSININTQGLIDSIADSLGTVATYSYFPGTHNLKE